MVLTISTSNHLTDLSDEALMLSYQTGIAAAFDELYARHKGGLFRYVLRQLNNHDALAQEIFQDIWMKIIKARLNYQASANFNTWLYRIAHNRLVDHWRSDKHTKQQVTYDELNAMDVDMLEGHSGTEPHNQLQKMQTRQQIIQAIAELPEEQRSAILLKEEAALSLLQIAEVTGVNRETVKSRLRYGIKKLQGILHPLRSVL